MRPTLFVLCLLFSTTLFAQQTRYRLERIAVEGSRVHEHIVRSEARLPEERDYTEDDFRQALYRIRRLPFVTDATYRIEPGLTAGSTTLVIRILDTTYVFYDATLAGFAREGEEHISSEVNASLGGRVFLDDLGVVEGRVQTFDDLDAGAAVGLTYRAYGLFDTSAFAVASVEQHFGAEARRYDPSRTVSLGWPLTQKQTLVLSAARAKSRLVSDFDVNGDDDDDDEDDDSDEDDNVPLSDRSDFSVVSLRWLYETHDDPLFATRGVRAEAGPFWSQSVFAHDVFDEVEDEVVAAKTRTTTYGLNARVTAYRPLGARNVLLLSAAADATDSGHDDNDLNDVSFYSARVRAAVAHDFHTHDDTVLRPFRARLEAGVSYGGTSRKSTAFGDTVRLDSIGADTSFVMRHRWGTLRLTGSYLWR